MANLIKLKQIENGTVIGQAAHPAAVLTNDVAPFAFNPVTQVGNIPATPSVTVAGNTLTFNAGNGASPVTYTPTIAADVFVQAGSYDSATQRIILQLSNSNDIFIPVSDLIPVSAADSTSVTLRGSGTNSDPLVAQVKLAQGPNSIVSTPEGLAVIPAGRVVFIEGENTIVDGDGTSAVPFKIRIKLQPDVPGTLYQPSVLNLLQAIQEDSPGQKGLGYAIDAIEFNGTTNNFNVAAILTKYAGLWNGVPEIAKVDGYVNGVLYADNVVNANAPWSYADYTAVQWLGGIFSLDTQDNIRFVVHVRAS